MLKTVARIGRGNPGRWNGVANTEEVVDVLRKGARMVPKQTLTRVADTEEVLDVLRKCVQMVQ